MDWLRLRVAIDVIQDLTVIESVAVADADAAIDHAELYCFVVHNIYLHFSSQKGKRFGHFSNNRNHKQIEHI